MRPTDPQLAQDNYVTPFDGSCGLSEILAEDDASTQRPSVPGVVPERPVVGPQQPMPTTSTESYLKHVLGQNAQPSGPQYLPNYLPIRKGQIGSL